MSEIELMKKMNRVRDYMREFYVYGFKNREEFTNKSIRTYDNERRRIESWLGEYYRYDYRDGKTISISIDSRKEKHNPLFKAWKAKAFTNNDIKLHFILLDILHNTVECGKSKSRIYNDVIDYGMGYFDDRSIGRKIDEYVKEGIIQVEDKKYKLGKDNKYYNRDILNYYSEVMPCGVVGSYLLDKDNVEEYYDIIRIEKGIKDIFTFKHHFITSSIDSEIMFAVLNALHEKRYLNISVISKQHSEEKKHTIVPLKVYISTQNGRQYVMAYGTSEGKITPYRLDNIIDIEDGNVCEVFDELSDRLKEMLPHIWGISTTQKETGLEHVEFVIKFEETEEYIYRRVLREKRCGSVELLDNNHLKFSADLYDSNEIIPWIKTFICRIERISFSNKEIENRLISDFDDMCNLYDIN